MRNCADVDSIIKIDPESGIKLDKNCNLVAKGCADVQDFKTADVNRFSFVRFLKLLINFRSHLKFKEMA